MLRQNLLPKLPCFASEDNSKPQNSCVFKIIQGTVVERIHSVGRYFLSGIWYRHAQLTTLLGTLPSFGFQDRDTTLSWFSSYLSGHSSASSASSCLNDDSWISISSSNLCPELQFHVSNFKFDISIWCLNRDLKLNMTQTGLLIPLSVPLTATHPPFLQLAKFSLFQVMASPSF